MPKEIKNHIVKEGSKWRLLSHDGKNLGTFDTEEEAKKHEADVEYFKEHTNASQSQKPNFYYARHMQPGTCRYDKEMILVDTDAMMQMIGTGAGIPVYIHHQVNVPIEDVKEKAAGYVTESFYNELDGWAWFKIMAIDDEIRLAKSNGWSVSDAYRPMNWAVGGTKNNVKFDREIVGGEFTHLAIVPNPRYEEALLLTPEEFKAYQDGRKAKIAELQNSNQSPSKGNPLMKLFSFKKQEVTNSAEATHVELADGKLVTLAEAAELLNGKAVKKQQLHNGDTVEVGKYKIRYIGDMESPDYDKTMVIKQGSVASGVLPTVPAGIGNYQPPPAQAGEPLSGSIKVLSGSAAGREVSLTKVVTTIGKPGVAVAAITRRPHGFVLAHVEGTTFPTLNGNAVGSEPVTLKSGDLLELAGTQMQFLQT